MNFIFITMQEIGNQALDFLVARTLGIFIRGAKILDIAESLHVHHSEVDENRKFAREDEWIDMTDEPDHDELCFREQQYFLKAIREDLDLNDHMEDALNSMRIVAAADESYKTGKTVEL